MSRPLRIDFPGAWHHVMNRGARKDPIFYSATDARSFLDLVGKARDDFGLETHAYCLMTNHYHLLVRSVDGQLSSAMRLIDGVYTQRFNRHNGYDGPLMRGRYRSLLVDSDNYLTTVAQYIHRNPIEAKMVDDLRSHRWSSYPAYLGEVRPERWLVMNELRSSLPRGRALRELTEDAPLPGAVAAFYAKERLGPVLGSAEFRRRSIERADRHGESEPHRREAMDPTSYAGLCEVVAEQFGVSVSSLVTPRRGSRNVARLVAIHLATQTEQRVLSDVTRFFGLTNSSSLSSVTRSLDQACQRDPDLVGQIATLAQRLAATDADGASSRRDSRAQAESE